MLYVWVEVEYYLMVVKMSYRKIVEEVVSTVAFAAGKRGENWYRGRCNRGELVAVAAEQGVEVELPGHREIHRCCLPMMSVAMAIRIQVVNRQADE